MLSKTLRRANTREHSLARWLVQRVMQSRRACSTLQVMRTQTHPFTWSEDLDESLNFWFWLRRSGGVDDAALRLRIQEWSGLHSYAGHLATADHPRFREYLSVGKDWRWNWVRRTVEDGRSERPRAYRARFRAIKSTGVGIRVQWVMATFGERWLFPPDLAVLGIEGSTAEGRRAAVLEAAQALQ
jgi:hypothetical protein